MTCACFFCTETPTADIYTYLHTLSRHYALPLYRERLELDPARLDEVRERIAALDALQRKYGTGEEEVLGFLARAAESLDALRSEERTSELQSLMRISYAVFCLKKQRQHTKRTHYKMHVKQYSEERIYTLL